MCIWFLNERRMDVKGDMSRGALLTKVKQRWPQVAIESNGYSASGACEMPIRLLTRQRALP